MNKFVAVVKPPATIYGVKEERFYHKHFGYFTHFRQPPSIVETLEKFLIFPCDDRHKTFTMYLERGLKNGRPKRIQVSPHNLKFLANRGLSNFLFFQEPLPKTLSSLTLYYEDPAKRYMSFETHYHALNREIVKDLEPYLIQEVFDRPAWQEYSSISSHIYMQRDDIPPTKGNVKIKVEISDKPDASGNLWVNPICLCLPVWGEELRHPVFQQIIDRENIEAILLAEPLFEQSYLGCIYFYLWGQKHIEKRTGDVPPDEKDYSRIEKPIWGRGKNTCSMWKPFAALDILRGAFYVCKNNSNYWRRPEDLPSNACYFADYWVNCWQGQEIKIAQTHYPLAAPLDARVLHYSRAGGLGLNRKDLENACCSLDKILERFPRWKTLFMETISHILQQKGMLNTPAIKDYLGYLMVDMKKGDQCRLYFDGMNYISQFAKKYIAPLSPVYIQFPDVNFEDEKETDEAKQKYREKLNDACVDIIHALPLGEQKFLEALCHSLVHGISHEEIKLPFRSGWWNDWQRALFSYSGTKPFKFYFPGGDFIIKKSIIGQDYLGKKQYYMQTSDIRF